MSQIDLAVTLFVSLMLTSLPFVLLGVAVSSFLLVFVNRQELAAKFPSNRLLGVLVGIGLGLLLPVGQYGTIPIARRFLWQGVPLAVVFSFLIAAPTLNVFTLWLTWQAFADRANILFYRSLWSMLMAIGIGILFSFYPQKSPKTAEVALESALVPSGSFRSAEEESQALGKVSNLVYEPKTSETTRKSWQNSLPLFGENLIREGLEFGGILIWGCVIATFFQLFLPQSQLIAWGQTPLTQIFVMLLFGFTLTVNASLSAFVPTSLTTTLFSGSILAYLLFGSLIDVKGFGLLLLAFRPQIVLYLVILVLLITLFASLTLSFLLS